MIIYQSLNEQQKRAVTQLTNPLLILAGAGSGKTRVITHKIMYLIQECQIQPSQIVAVTFTNKAAQEMVQRVSTHLKKENLTGLNVSTFHTFGLQFLKKEHHHLHLKQNFTIFDREDALSLLRELACQDILLAKDTLEDYLQKISFWKNRYYFPEVALQNAQNDSDKQIARLYHHYQKQLKHYNALDLDDLLLLPLYLLKENPDIREKWQNKIRYLLVDEYQDTNSIQYELIRLLSGVRASFTVVGDDHQSIYAWRGACPENLLQLQKDYPNLTVIKLEQNYRSTSIILNAANHVISHNTNLFEKNLWSQTKTGDPIRVLCAKDEEHEANQIVNWILKHKFQNNAEYHDYAILYRSNHQAYIFEKVLRELHIPYQLSGGTSFFSKTEIKDLLAYLKLLINPDDDCAFLRIVNTPRREIGPASLEKLASYALERNISLFSASFELGLEQHLPQRSIERLRYFTHWILKCTENIQPDPINSIYEMIKEMQYENWLLETSSNPKVAERRLENLYSAIEWLSKIMNPPDNDTLDFGTAVNKMILMDMLEHTQESLQNSVQLLTLHAAKGLEFPYVCIAGMEEEQLPHRTSIEEDTIEEERRLFYVGLTRAKKTLLLSFAKTRQRYQETIQRVPSRFLNELPVEDVIWDGLEPTSAEERLVQGRTHLANIRSLLPTTEEN